MRLIFGRCAFVFFILEISISFANAQDCLHQHLASMKASEKSAEAAVLETRLYATKAEPGISEKLDAAIQAGSNAMLTSHLDEAVAEYKEAVGLAETLQPHDDRLATSLIRLASLYAGKKDFARTEAALRRALDANVELYGAASLMTIEPLQALASYALSKNDYKSALDFYSRAVEVNEKTFGECSDEVADSLWYIANVHILQGSYDKAEPYLLRAVHIDESLYGQNGSDLNNLPLWHLSDLYDKWNKPAKAEPRYRQMLAILEKEYGADSTFLLSTLTVEAKTLRQLRRTDEAAKVERRLQSIRAGTDQTEGAALTPHP